MSDFKFLSKVYQLLNDEGVFQAKVGFEYVDFKQPKELEQILDLKFKDESLEEAEIGNLLQKIIQYSVKSNHPMFQNELYGGYDPFCLAASWITDALNNCQ